MLDFLREVTDENALFVLVGVIALLAIALVMIVRLMATVIGKFTAVLDTSAKTLSGIAVLFEDLRKTLNDISSKMGQALVDERERFDSVMKTMTEHQRGLEGKVDSLHVDVKETRTMLMHILTQNNDAEQPDDDDLTSNQ